MSPQREIRLAPKPDEMTDGSLLLLCLFKYAVTVFTILRINLKESNELHPTIDNSLLFTNLGMPYALLYEMTPSHASFTGMICR